MDELSFPTGKIITSNAPLSTHNAFEILQRKMQEKFTGYLAITIQGKSGLEDGVIALEKGEVIAASYYYHKSNLLFNGREAQERVENALACKTGVFDLVELTTQQVQLAVSTAKTPALAVKKLQKLTEFSEDLENQGKGVKAEHGERSELLKKYGLSALAQ